MRLLRYSALLIKKNIFFSILVIILIFLSTILINSMLVISTTEDRNVTLYNSILDKNGIFVPMMYSSSVEASTMQVAEQYANDIDIFSITRLYCAENYTIQGLSSEFLANLSIDVYGEMPYVPDTKNYIPIITNTGAIGDTYQIYTTYTDTETLTFVTVGIMSTPYPTFNFAGGNALSDTVVWNNGAMNTTFIFATEALPAATDAILNTASSAFVVIKDDVSAVDVQEIIAAFSAVTQVFSFYELIDYQTSKVDTFSQSFLPFAISTTTIAIANFFMCALLSNVKNKKLFATLYISGAHKRHILGIVIASGLILSLLPTLLGSAVFILVNPMAYFTGASVSVGTSILIAISISAVFCGLCLLSFLLTVKQYELSNILKGVH